MAYTIEGYSRPNTGQTIPVKNQKKSTPASKPQTVTKSSSNISGAVYTASRFEDIAKSKSIYTAKGTYTNPVLAKKQSTIAQVAQSNKEAAKTTPNALSVAKNFFGGVVDAGVSTAVSLYNLGRHPVQTAKAIGTVIAHPVQTAEAIKEIAVELKDDFKEGNADVKVHMIGRAVGEIGLAIVGTKMVDKVTKGLKTVKVTKATTEVAEAAEETAKVAKAVSTAVNVAEEVADEAASVGQVASKGENLAVRDIRIQDNPNIKVNKGHQDKHIIGTNNYKQEIANGKPRSILTEEPQSLLDNYAGTGQKIETNKERVDFKKKIGQYYDKETETYMDTTKGIIHYDNKGQAHIVPARP